METDLAVAPDTLLNMVSCGVDIKKMAVGACHMGARNFECFAPNAMVKPAVILHLYHWMIMKMKMLHQHD